jgi:hypothetical protein
VTGPLGTVRAAQVTSLPPGYDLLLLVLGETPGSSRGVLECCRVLQIARPPGPTAHGHVAVAGGQTLPTRRDVLHQLSGPHGHSDQLGLQVRS